METNPSRRQESLQGLVTRTKPLQNVNSRLRHLDVDDLYLLMLLGDGKKLADVARALSLSQPAITQRVHKIEQTLGISILERSTRGTRLTETGLTVCRRSGEAMSLLERFFEGIPRTGYTVAVTGAWSAWLMASAVTNLLDQWDGIDVEYMSPELLLRGSHAWQEFANVVVTLHRKTDSSLPPGCTSVSTISRPIVLWGKSGHDFSRADQPLPLIEVSRLEALLTSQMRDLLEARYPGIRGIRFAGTVAGAVKMAAKGHGLLVAPQSEAELGLGLGQVLSDAAIGNVDFELLVDDRAPHGDLIKQIINALH